MNTIIIAGTVTRAEKGRAQVLVKPSNTYFEVLAQQPMALGQFVVVRGAMTTRDLNGAKVWELRADEVVSQGVVAPALTQATVAKTTVVATHRAPVPLPGQAPLSAAIVSIAPSPVIAKPPALSVAPPPGLGRAKAKSEIPPPPPDDE